MLRKREVPELFGDMLSGANTFAGGVDDFPAQPAIETDEKDFEKQVTALEQRAKTMLQCIEKYRKTGEKQALVTYIEEVERARYQARNTLPYLPERAPKAQSSNGEIRDVEVSEPPGTVLKLVLIPLVAEPIKGAYNVYHEVKEALVQYLSDHKISLDRAGRYTLMYRRVVVGALALAAGKCDNDNFEMQRVTNAITEAIGIADSVDKFSFYYTTVSGDTARTEVFLLKETDFLAGFHPENTTNSGPQL